MLAAVVLLVILVELLVTFEVKLAAFVLFVILLVILV